MTRNHKWGVLMISLVLIGLLAACAPITAPASAPAEGAAPASEAAAPAGSDILPPGTSLSGNVTFHAPSPLPAETVLRVEVINPLAGPYPANVIAATEVPAGGLESPIPYTIPLDGVGTGSGRAILLARLLLNGSPLFGSVQGIALADALASGGAVDLEVVPAPPMTAFMGEPAESAGVVGGRVTWDDGSTMPTGADLVVEIVNGAESDPSAEPFAVTMLDVSGKQSPVVFELQVSTPDMEGEYQIQAFVMQGDTMTWESKDGVTWGTGDAPFTNIELPIVPIEGAKAKAAAEVGGSGLITGTVGYLQKMALPEGAKVDVALVDLNVGSVIAQHSARTTGEQPPIPFQISFPQSQVDPDGQYGLLARIMIGDAPVFATLQPVPVLTGDAPASGVNLVLEKVGEPPAPQGEAPAAYAVTGVVTFKEPDTLPSGAVVEVRLQDVSRADAPANVIFTQVITTTGEQPPIPFSLNFNPAEVDDRFTYTVGARINVDGKLAWINDTAIPVITRGAPVSDVDVPVVKVP